MLEHPDFVDNDLVEVSLVLEIADSPLALEVNEALTSDDVRPGLPRIQLLAQQ